MKRIFALLIALSMITASFISCSDTQDESDIGAEDQNSAPISDESETEPDDAGEAVIYERVVLIGVDGAGAFFKDTDTPNIDRIFENGAVTYEMQASTPSISAQCWGSMLLGVTPEVHRLTNSVVGASEYGGGDEFPSIFKVVRDKYPNATLASFCNWNPINVGIIENGIGVDKRSGSDAEVTKLVCDFVAENDPKLLFVHFDEVDGAGHGTGYGTQRHLDQITTSDGYIGQIYDAYEARGFIDETLFIVTADHGGSGTGHGGDTPGEMNVMYAIAGKSIEKGTIGEMEIRDNASIILHALGCEQPEIWTARIPDGVFEGVEAGERPEYVFEIKYDYEYRTAESTPTPAADSGEYITDVFGDRVLAYLPLDNDSSDATGQITTTENGKLYYVDGFYGNAAEFDDGYISIADYAPGKSSFTLSAWIKTTASVDDPSIFSNKNWNSGSNPGYILSLRSGDIKFNLGNGSSRMDSEFPLPRDFYDGWLHILLSVDRENGKIGFSYDFNSMVIYDIPSNLKNSSFDAFDVLNIGQDGTGSYSSKLAAILDDIVILDGAATEEDIAALKGYYNLD